jgi:Curlin associated repeat
MRISSIGALSLALIVGLAPFYAAPAQAKNNGSVSLTISPNGRDAEVIREGLQIYSLFKSAKNRAKVDQRGAGNGAAIAQHGSGNTAEVFQRGKGNQATIEQTGNNNWFGVFQFGKKNNAVVSQNGNGRTGLILQGGW